MSRRRGRALLASTQTVGLRESSTSTCRTRPLQAGSALSLLSLCSPDWSVSSIFRKSLQLGILVEFLTCPVDPYLLRHVSWPCPRHERRVLDEEGSGATASSTNGAGRAAERVKIQLQTTLEYGCCIGWLNRVATSTLDLEYVVVQSNDGEHIFCRLAHVLGYVLNGIFLFRKPIPFPSISGIFSSVHSHNKI